MSHTVGPDESLRLVVSEDDLPAGVLSAIEARETNAQMLGSERDTKRAFWDGVAAAVLKRVRAIGTDDFSVKEVELKFEVDGKLFGTGIGGEVSVTFAPKA